MIGGIDRACADHGVAAELRMVIMAHPAVDGQALHRRHARLGIDAVGQGNLGEQFVGLDRIIGAAHPHVLFLALGAEHQIDTPGSAQHALVFKTHSASMADKAQRRGFQRIQILVVGLVLLHRQAVLEPPVDQRKVQPGIGRPLLVQRIIACVDAAGQAEGVGKAGARAVPVSAQIKRHSGRKVKGYRAAGSLPGIAVGLRAPDQGGDALRRKRRARNTPIGQRRCPAKPAMRIDRLV